MSRIKEILNRTRLGYVLKRLLLKMNSKKSLSQIEEKISRDYKKYNGKEMSWENPGSYTEKIAFSKLYCATEEKIRLTDKFLVREWVAQKIGEEYLTPLLGVYKSFNEIDFSKLPDDFVLKCNHDSGSTTLIHKKNFDYKKLKHKYDLFMKRNFAYYMFEMHYKNIQPCIMVEELLTDGDSGGIKDYKFMCFNGEPVFCWVDSGRFTEHKRTIYDMNWQPQEFKQRDYAQEVLTCPKQFNELKHIAKVLSQGIDQVRVDLYEVNGKIYFSEMTFTNGGGYEKISPSSWDKKLGQMWKLDLSERNRMNKS